MERRFIKNLRIQKYRGCLDFSVSGFEQVNLITGANNSGKSTLLEAVQILASKGSFQTFEKILHLREENLREDEETANTSFANLFYNFPDLLDCSTPFSISSTFQEGIEKISLSIEELVKEGEEWVSIVNDESLEMKESALFIKIAKETSGKPPSHLITRLGFDTYRRSRLFPKKEHLIMPCIALNLYSLKSTSHLSSMWDKISLTPLEDIVIETLQTVLSPEISSIAMLSQNESSTRRVAYAKHKDHLTPIPLKSFGDGVNRLFGMILSLVSAKGGVFIIDEIETGFHYSIMPKVWQAIFTLAKELEIQVFASSHSLDCVRAFSEVANNDQGVKGAIIRLNNMNGEMSQTHFNEQDLQNANEMDLELR